MKKKIFFFVIIFCTVSCVKNDKTLAQQDGLTNKPELTWAQLEEIYEKGEEFMLDARSQDIRLRPFSYKDVFEKEEIDLSIYPFSKNEGSTSVYFNDSVIWSNTWNYSYTAGWRSMTDLQFGEITESRISIFKLSNESFFPEDNSYQRENKIFIYNGNKLIELGPFDGYYFHEIREVKLDDSKVLILKTSPFPRAFPKYEGFFLIDPLSGEYLKYEKEI